VGGTTAEADGNVSSIQGVRNGRDEALDELVRQILGADLPAGVVQRIAEP
jgi:hypothetical protein